MYTTTFTAEIAQQHIQDLHREAGTRRLAKLATPAEPDQRGCTRPATLRLVNRAELARRLGALTDPRWLEY